MRACREEIAALAMQRKEQDRREMQMKHEAAKEKVWPRCAGTAAVLQTCGIFCTSTRPGSYGEFAGLDDFMSVRAYSNAPARAYSNAPGKTW
jgi:hypothetical protein